ncbi:MAG TPA: hypothetical protein PLU46_09135 [Thiotrichales bacterium]|nr:hypothetical protein [Thiotrichales bacterium]HQT05135.1 hypothetical protein [Thiotrichales bacterium]
MSTETSESPFNHESFKAFLSIKTDWTIKKNTMPLFALSGLAKFCKIPIEMSDDIQDLPSLMKHAQALAQAHFVSSEGKVTFWGNIQSYSLCYQLAYYEPTQCISIWNPTVDELPTE